jgi:GDP-mannose 6-dehydrogenase
MRISVFGLGYVGSVSAACLAARGHQVVGVDVNATKVELMSRGQAPVVEERIGELTAEMVQSGALRAITDVAEAVESTEISLVCVGTPSAANGSLSTTYLERVCEQIGATLAGLDRWHTVVLRSTMLPGTCTDLLIPILEKHSGKTAGVDFGVAFNPEFLREGSSVRDFFDPPKTVIGVLDDRSADEVTAMYAGLPGEVFRVPIEVAEMAKYADNAFHGLKIAFANELGAICRALGVDSHKMIDVFLADTKLNISPAYLRPGFAFGGSCLPKDLRGLVYAAHRGLSFKPGTDDLRESPLVELAERLLGKGFDLKIYDANVALSRLIGANRAYIEERLPHLGDLLSNDAEEVAAHAEVCIVGTKDAAALAALPAPGDKIVVDLVRIPDAESRRAIEGYYGLGW